MSEPYQGRRSSTRRASRASRPDGAGAGRAQRVPHGGGRVRGDVEHEARRRGGRRRAPRGRSVPARWSTRGVVLGLERGLDARTSAGRRRPPRPSRASTDASAGPRSGPGRPRGSARASRRRRSSRSRSVSRRTTSFSTRTRSRSRTAPLAVMQRGPAALAGRPAGDVVAEPCPAGTPGAWGPTASSTPALGQVRRGRPRRGRPRTRRRRRRRTRPRSRPWRSPKTRAGGGVGVVEAQILGRRHGPSLTRGARLDAGRGCRDSSRLPGEGQ